MIVAGIHNDFENPPNIPAFNGNSAKRTRRNGLSEVLNDAATAFVEAINPLPPIVAFWQHSRAPPIVAFWQHFI